MTLLARDLGRRYSKRTIASRFRRILQGRTLATQGSLLSSHTIGVVVMTIIVVAVVTASASLLLPLHKAVIGFYGYDK